VAFVVLGAVYSVVVPPFEASDEKWHYPMIKYIADHWSLPVQEPGVETPWRQEGSQPPLYYFLGALVTCWIDTSDMETVRHLNPHVDPGATPDGNVNLVVHNPALESFPWRGTVLAVHIVRLLSVLMGAAAVYLTYLIVRQVLPNEGDHKGRPYVALAAAAIHACTPMYVFISGSVNNDNLVVPLCSLALLMLLRLLPNAQSGSSDPRLSQVGPVKRWIWRSNASVQLGRYLALGVVLGLAALTKSSSLALTVITALVVVVRAVRRRSRTEFFVGGLATLLPLLLIAGWWYLRNLRLYGDLTGLNAFTEILGTRDVPANLAQLWRERYSFLAGYWGNFGGLNVPLPTWVYTVLNTLTVIAALGLLLTLLRTALPSLSPPLPCSPAPLLLCLLWGLGVFIPWLWWSRVTWSSQGRLVFPAISVWSLLLALGLSSWLPRRLFIVHWSLVIFLLGLSALAPFAWIAPAYALPEPLTNAQVAAIPHPMEADFGGVMRLLGYDLETELPPASGGAGGVKPGGQVAVTLYWEALAPADRVRARLPRSYTVFVHLLGEHDLLVTQRDTFPGLGLFSTTWLEPGDAWADRYVLQVPPTAYAPDLAQVEMGLYDATTGARLPASTGGDNVRFGQVEIRARPGDASLPVGGIEGGGIPNPVSVNFDNQMALVGYDLDRRAVRPGEMVALTLYWRGLRRMDVNYTVSVQFVNSDWVKAAQQDTWPVGGTAPTSTWQPGVLIEDAYDLTIADVPPGVYDVRLTVYRFDEEGNIVTLPTIPQGGRMQTTHVVLTQMRVTP
jgi:4-amino-4-deoxy-L-arabinose transferase-like glycosyltransferase